MQGADVICIGTGGVGSSVMWQLARRGVSVIGLDRFTPGHDRGSSHGRSRVIRLAYFEHPDYVPLLVRSYELWRELEAMSGKALYTETGLLEVGPPHGVVVPGVRQAAALHDLAVENLGPEDVAERFPGFLVDPSTEAVFEQQAGVLAVEECVRTHIELAVGAGAVLNTAVTVTGWRPDGHGVVVETDAGVFGADHLVVTAGPWAAQLLADQNLPLRVRRKALFWFSAPPLYDLAAGCPLFFYETQAGLFYGFPSTDDSGVKVACHSGGEAVADPLALDRRLRAEDQAEVTDFLAAHLPGVRTEQLRHHAVCMYTDTPDGHFIVDRHDRFPQVSFAAGLSGHGFKMATVLGEILADGAVSGNLSPNAAFLSSRRASLAMGWG